MDTSKLDPRNSPTLKPQIRAKLKEMLDEGSRIFSNSCTSAAQLGALASGPSVKYIIPSGMFQLSPQCPLHCFRFVHFSVVVCNAHNSIHFYPPATGMTARDQRTGLYMRNNPRAFGLLPKLSANGC